MKALYLDLGMGAAGDMLAAALYDSLSDEQKKAFITITKNLGIEDVVVEIKDAKKCGISGSHVDVLIDGVLEESLDEHEHHHDHHHDHEHNHHDHDHREHHHTHHHHSLNEIYETIDRLNISKNVKSEVKEIYKELAEAESHVHGIEISEIHLHEVGAVDAIVDISLACVLMEMVGADKVYASSVHVGAGKVRCAHGILPVPAPATAYLLKDIPIYGGKIQGELCTPTGAVLIKHFVDEFGDMPVMKVKSTGYGMGNKDFEVANCIRVFVGETADSKDVIYEIDFNVDDMTSEEIGFLLETLMDNGARDTFVIPVTMKKSRPGHLITVITDEGHKELIIETIFRHSTTIGIREKECNRYILDRKIETVSTQYGPVRKKTVSGYGVKRAKYEYEDLASIAKEKGISLQKAREDVRLEEL